ncbi:MAG TPA: preprotein translocase subunit SecG [Clostridiales bacterium]|nr:preprotein translocase subunit SecG [Clostridiales bacterium]
MDILKVVVQIVYILVCIVLTFLVLKQEGKSEGLSGALTGSTDTYWSKNKSRSKEGFIENTTKVLGVTFILLSVALNLL